MKKRSMLAIASLATGFVVAAVTPSHSLDLGKDLNHINVDDTLSTLGHTVSSDSLDGVDETALGQNR
ncbi:hypothetical protein OHT57_05885 [Streptomyces sp. NBC_00285]|jgi:hypothetical protein|uniref:hypothetical protein n=1 Tax=Streptomyces sp. NBC_00285 TaxID=2975700 RepID=UPI002E2BA40B|nr:hypothetical protein [Streptomyces sp. NBC_00285]